MSDQGLGFGGFLLGLGVGWYFFQYIDLGFEAFSYLLILMGLGMILSGLLTKGRKQHPISGIYGGIIGGLFLAAILTQGVGFVVDITDEFTELSDGPYRVTEQFTMTPPVTGDSLEINIDSVNGGIDVYPWEGDTVKFEVEVKVRGDSNAEAEDRLDDFDSELTTNTVNGVQELSLSFPLTMQQWSYFSVSIDVYVPSTIETDYYLETTNGAVNIHDLTGNTFDLSTTNGGITLDNVVAEAINADTTNGVIVGNINTPRSSLHTTNGAISISLSQTSGIHDLGTTNGLIELNLPTGSDVGYKVNFDTSIGALDVNLPDMDYDVDSTRTKIGESNSYATKTIQIEVNAETTIGGIEVN